MTTMPSNRCPDCRHLLLHRGAPTPRASRCCNPGCSATFDPDGQRITDDGPWPTAEEVGPLEGTGSYHDQNSGGSWSWRNGSRTGPLT